jgi:hypothetical protein
MLRGSAVCVYPLYTQGHKHMKNVVITLQEENWEDDGGDHDPSLVTISDDEFAQLQIEHEAGDTVSSNRNDEILKMIDTAPSPALPCEMHGVFGIWYNG